MIVVKPTIEETKEIAIALCSGASVFMDGYLYALALPLVNSCEWPCLFCQLDCGRSRAYKEICKRCRKIKCQKTIFVKS